MKVPPPLRLLRFTLDACFTSRGELVAVDLRLYDSLKKKDELIGGSSGGTGEITAMLLRQIDRRIKEATV